MQPFENFETLFCQFNLYNLRFIVYRQEVLSDFILFRTSGRKHHK